MIQQQRPKTRGGRVYLEEVPRRLTEKHKENVSPSGGRLDVYITKKHTHKKKNGRNLDMKAWFIVNPRLRIEFEEIRQELRPTEISDMNKVFHTVLDLWKEEAEERLKKKKLSELVTD